MAKILHQLRLVVYPIIYRVLAPSQVVGNGISEPSTVWLLTTYLGPDPPSRIGLPENFVNFWDLHLQVPEPFMVRTLKTFLKVWSLMCWCFPLGFPVEPWKKTGRTSLNGGSSEMKDAKNHAEMLIASLPFFVECKTKNFWTDMFDHFFQSKVTQKQNSHCLQAFSQMYHDGELDTQEVPQFTRGVEEVGRNFFQGVFGIPSLKLTWPMKIPTFPGKYH